MQARLWTGWLWKGLQGSLKEVQSKNCDQRSPEKAEQHLSAWKVIDIEMHIIACATKINVAFHITCVDSVIFFASVTLKQ